MPLSQSIVTAFPRAAYGVDRRKPNYRRQSAAALIWVNVLQLSVTTVDIRADNPLHNRDRTKERTAMHALPNLRAEISGAVFAK